MLLCLLARNVETHSLQEKQLPVVVKNAGAALVDPQRRAITSNYAIVNIPFALGFNAGAHRAIYQANVLGRNYGAEGPNIVVEEIRGGIARQAFYAAGHEQHRVTGIILAAIEEAVEPSGDALNDACLQCIVQVSHRHSQGT